MESLHLLVVDDELGMRMAVCRALEGFTVHMPEFQGVATVNIDTAASGEEAVEKLQSQAVDILLLDYKLPGISGLDVLERIGKTEIDCLTVMITAYASLETAVTATKRGAYDFLAKPFTPGELKSVVHKAAKHLLLRRQARKLAEEKRRVRFELTSVVAHELKAPLGAIEGYLYLLRDRPAGNDISAYETAVERSIVRLGGMRKLINDLLDLTRLESGQKKRELVDVDLAEIAEQAIETVTPEAQQRDIAVELQASGDLSVVADPGEMEIIFNNLLTNAVKYNRDGGRVDVRVDGSGKRIVIAVQDTGIGMSEDEVAKLFGEFVRIKNPKTRNIMGTGLGLSILKKIAALYGGQVRVESQENIGSTFHVTLDRKTRPPESEPQPAE
ncbi:MAG: ATP-binding protein [Candidatus Lernaella stagnicola]|nr:ATP-binding protein [Candidatus Lernaella stagnicola]